MWASLRCVSLWVLGWGAQLFAAYWPEVSFSSLPVGFFIEQLKTLQLDSSGWASEKWGVGWRERERRRECERERENMNENPLRDCEREWEQKECSSVSGLFCFVFYTNGFHHFLLKKKILKFYCCSSTVSCLFAKILPHTPAIPTSLPWSYLPCFCDLILKMPYTHLCCILLIMSLKIQLTVKERGFNGVVNIR